VKSDQYQGVDEMIIGKRSATSRRDLLAITGAAALSDMLSSRRARAADKVVLRTNWIFYGSHGIFLLGVDDDLYAKSGIDADVKQGNGSGNAVQLVANKDSTFAYASSVTMMTLAAKGAPVISVCTIDAQGTDAVLANPDSGIKTFKDLEGKQVMTTAGAGVNTLFPVACKNAGVDIDKIKIVNVAESALVPSYLQGLAPAILGGIDDKPAEIEASGGKPPIALTYARYGVAQPGYSIVAHRDMVNSNPDLVKRFVGATLASVKAAQANPDAAVAAVLKAQGGTPDEKQRVQNRKVLDVTLSILISPKNTEKRLGLNVPDDWQSALDLLKTYQGLQADKPASYFYTNEFVPT
jgi:NitT/TauT family transport system substrate-binding protein